MNAIILYDSLTLASKATAMLRRAAANAGQEANWNLISWRTESLRSQSFSELALDEAIDSHLIVCAWLNFRPFHQWIEDWLEQWTVRREYEESAIAMLGEGHDISCGSAEIALSRFSELHGVSLIVGKREIPDTFLSNADHDILCGPHLDHGRRGGGF
jgi:hypothetical protein